jgi:hypothetical protein
MAWVAPIAIVNELPMCAMRPVAKNRPAPHTSIDATPETHG